MPQKPTASRHTRTDRHPRRVAAELPDIARAGPTRPPHPLGCPHRAPSAREPVAARGQDRAPRRRCERWHACATLSRYVPPAPAHTQQASRGHTRPTGSGPGPRCRHVTPGPLTPGAIRARPRTGCVSMGRAARPSPTATSERDSQHVPTTPTELDRLVRVMIRGLHYPLRMNWISEALREKYDGCRRWRATAAHRLPGCPPHRREKPDGSRDVALLADGSDRIGVGYRGGGLLPAGATERSGGRPPERRQCTSTTSAPSAHGHWALRRPVHRKTAEGIPV